MHRKDVVLVIDNYDSFTYNLVQYLGELGEEVLVRRNDEITLPEIAEGEFTGHEGMPEDPSAIEEPAEPGISSLQMTDPDRGVDQYHSGFSRSRGAATRSGWLPPKRASRRALSRSISALSASRTNADFSRRPV